MIPGDWSWWDTPITWHQAITAYGWYLIMKAVISVGSALWHVWER